MDSSGIDGLANTEGLLLTEGMAARDAVVSGYSVTDYATCVSQVGEGGGELLRVGVRDSDQELVAFVDLDFRTMPSYREKLVQCATLTDTVTYLRGQHQRDAEENQRLRNEDVWLRAELERLRGALHRANTFQMCFPRPASPPPPFGRLEPARLFQDFSQGDTTDDGSTVCETPPRSFRHLSQKCE